MKRLWALLSVVFGLSVPVFGGFPSKQVYLVAVGRGPGAEGSHFFTTVWVTNLTGASEAITFDFLQQGQANTSPVSFTDTLAPGQTRLYEDVVQSKLGLESAQGAARITSDGEIFASERIFNQLPGEDLGKTEGLSFSAVPGSFSILPGKSASIQGVNQGGSESFRSNFVLVETGGGSPTVHVQVLDADGNPLGAKDYSLAPYEQTLDNVASVAPSIATTNARIVATVTTGPGSVLLAGAQIANESQDATGFEMSFPDVFGGVTSLNGLIGDLTLEAGTNIAIAQDGANALRISATVAQGPAGPRGATGATGPPGPAGPVNAVSTDTPNTASLRDGSGNFAMNTLTLDGNLNLPATTSSTGILFVAGHPFLHSLDTRSTFVGSDAGNLTMTGQENTATGVDALVANTTGHDNTAVGANALAFNTTGSFNIAIGAGTGNHLSTGDMNIDIGNPGVAGEGQTIRIGAEAIQTAAFIAGIRGSTTGNNDAAAVVIDSNGQLGTISSSRRFKDDICDMGSASDRLLRLRPVTFRYKKPFADGEKPIQYGLIAEEVAEIFPDLVAYGRDKRPETVKYQVLSSLLLNELEKQHAKIQDQAFEMTSLKKELTEQRAAFAALAARVSGMERRAAPTELARREVGAN